MWFMAQTLSRAFAQESDIAATVIRVKHDATRRVGQVPILRSWSFEASWEARWALNDRLAGGQADAMFIHTQASALLAAHFIRSIPTIISMDATPMNYDSVGKSYGHIRQGPALEWVKRRVNRRAMSAAAAIVTWSHWAAQSVVNDYGIHERKVQVIRPGVDLQRFHPGSQSRAPGPARILFVGADFVRKGGQDLLKAMPYLGDLAELDIITASRPLTSRRSCRFVSIWVWVMARTNSMISIVAPLFVLPSRSDATAGDSGSPRQWTSRGGLQRRRSSGVGHRWPQRDVGPTG